MAVVLKTGTPITVTTAGTKVQMPTIDRCVAVYFAGPAANSGIVYVGDTTVSISTGFPIVKSTNAFKVEAPQGQIIDTASIYVDAATNGDKVAYSYLQLTS